VKPLAIIKMFILSSILAVAINSKAEETLQVSDLILDYDTFIGKEVTVRGVYMQMGDMAFLYEELGSMTFISVDSSKADREFRKYLLKNCGSGCAVSLSGVVGEVMFSKGLTLTKVNF